MPLTSKAASLRLINSSQNAPLLAGEISLNTSEGTGTPPGKFVVPGVPPGCVLKVQLSAGALPRLGWRLASDTPEPSGPTGHSPSVR